MNRNPTENSIKVLIKILTNISVPKSFINNYIKNAITFFENNILTKDDEIPNEINYLFEIDSEEINKMKKIIIENKNNY